MWAACFFFKVDLPPMMESTTLFSLITFIYSYVFISATGVFHKHTKLPLLLNKTFQQQNIKSRED